MDVIEQPVSTSVLVDTRWFIDGVSKMDTSKWWIVATRVGDFNVGEFKELERGRCVRDCVGACTLVSVVLHSTSCRRRECDGRALAALIATFGFDLYKVDPRRGTLNKSDIYRM